MKKVLFISLAEHTTLGGTQNYNYKLMLLFKKLGWEITEYNCQLGIDKVVRKRVPKVNVISNTPMKPYKFRLQEGYRFGQQVKKSTIDIVDIVNNQNYDLIIDTRQNPYYWNKKWGNDFSKTNKCIWVQHFFLGLFDGKHLSKYKTIERLINWWTNKASKNRYNVLYSHKNIVLFDENNKKHLNLERFKTNEFNIFTSMLSEYDKEYIESQKAIQIKDRIYDFIYIGRINNIQKNITFINKVFKNSKYKLLAIGSGEKKYEKILKNNSNINYIGHITQEEVGQYFKQSKFLFLPSNYEGFPYVIVQALSHGVIPIILNTYESAETFSDISYVFPKNTSSNEMKKQLDIIYKKYNEELPKRAIKFASSFLCNEKFYETWTSIIKKIINL